MINLKDLLINNEDEFLKVIESVHEATNKQSISILCNSEISDFIRNNIKLPYYCGITSMPKSIYNYDDKIFIIPKQDPHPPIKFRFEDPDVDDYLKNIFKNI